MLNEHGLSPRSEARAYREAAFDLVFADVPIKASPELYRYALAAFGSVGNVAIEDIQVLEQTPALKGLMDVVDERMGAWLIEH